MTVHMGITGENSEFKIELSAIIIVKPELNNSVEAKYVKEDLTNKLFEVLRERFPVSAITVKK